MRLVVMYAVYCAVILVGLIVADRNGWILSGMGRGGIGRSYSAYNHK